MLFCPSFTQSERFLQTDQLIIRLQVVVVINFIRMLMRNVFVNVFKSDAVILAKQRSSANCPVCGTFIVVCCSVFVLVFASVCCLSVSSQGIWVLQFIFAHILVCAPIDGPGSQPMDATGPHCVCNHRMCVIAKRPGSLHRLAHAAGHGCFLRASTSRRSVFFCFTPFTTQNADQKN